MAMVYDASCESVRNNARVQLEGITGKLIHPVIIKQLTSVQWIVCISISRNGKGFTVDWFGSAHCATCAEAKAYTECFETINEGGDIQHGIRYQEVETNGDNRVGGHVA